MNKMILTAVVVALAATANAGALSTQSSTGSKNSAAGSYGISKASIGVVVDSSVGAFLASGASLDASSTATGKFLAYVIGNPLEASGKGLEASGKASGVALTTSGQVINVSFQGSAMFVQHPITTTVDSVKASGKASAKAYRVTVDASGNVLTASGDFLVDKSGKPMRLILDGSGDISTASVGSVILTYDKSAYVVKAAWDGTVSAVQFSGETIGDSVLASVATSVTSAQELSAGNLIASIRTILEMPVNAFDASAAVGYQNGLVK